MEHIYDILIAGQTVHKGVSEGDFFEIMEDLATAQYETGNPDLSKISHIMYTKE